MNKNPVDASTPTVLYATPLHEYETQIGARQLIAVCCTRLRSCTPAQVVFIQICAVFGPDFCSLLGEEL